jgi:hypothetical protein
MMKTKQQVAGWYVGDINLNVENNPILATEARLKAGRTSF